MNKVAFTFVGAGAAGINQIGHIEALEASGVKYNWLAGTSSGSLNAAGYHQGSLEQLKDIWLQIKNRDVFDINLITLTGILKNAGGIANSEPLQEFLSDFLKISKMPKEVPFMISATDEKNRVPFQKYASDLTQEDLVRLCYASASVPVLFSSVEYLDDRLGKVTLTDGGLCANMTLKEAVSWGADTIYISLPRNTATTKVGKSLERLGNMILTLMENMIYREIKLIQAFNQVEGRRFINLCVIKPTKITTQGLLDFDNLGTPQERRSLIALHKEDALRQIQLFQRQNSDRI